MSFFQKSIFLALVAIIFAIPQIADAQNTTKEPISFRGIPIDGTNVISQVTKLCEDNSENSHFTCNSSGDRNMIFEAEFGNINGYISLNFTENWAIASIYIFGRENQMIELANILASKYGKPARENNVVRSNAGAEFNQIIYRWKDARGNTMTVFSIDGKVGKGTFVLQSAEGIAANKKEREMEEQRSKSKL